MNHEPEGSKGVEDQVRPFVALETALDAQISAVLSRNREDLEKATADLERLVDQYQIALLNQQVGMNGNGLQFEIQETTQRVRSKIRRAQRLIETSLKFFEEQLVLFASLGPEGEYTRSGHAGDRPPTGKIIEVRS